MKTSLFFIAILFLSNAECMACGSSQTDSNFTSNKCEFRGVDLSRADWINLIEQHKKECSFNEEDIKWLSEAGPGTSIVELDESEYKDALSEYGKPDFKKPNPNFSKQERIDSWNRCDLRRILKRWKQWTVISHGRCIWRKEFDLCACPKC